MVLATHCHQYTGEAISAARNLSPPAGDLAELLPRALVAAIVMSAKGEARTMWYISSCPAPHPCSKGSWDRAKKCESWVSEDDCARKLEDHLDRSSYHAELSKEEKHTIVDRATIMMYTPSAEELAEWDAWTKKQGPTCEPSDTESEPETKKSKKPPAKDRSRTGGKSREVRTPPRSPSRPAEADNPLAAAIVKAVRPTKSGSASSSSGDIVPVPRAKLLAMLDHIDRCTAGLRSARDMADAASAAFDSEMKKLREVRREINQCMEGVNL